MAKAAQLISVGFSGSRAEVSSLKAYSTQERLNAKLTELGFINDRHIVVKTLDDRYTAIFPVSNIQDGNIQRYSYHGFMTMG